MKILNSIPAWLKNKYFLSVAIFTVWMLFFDDRDIYTTYISQRTELRNLNTSKTYYERQIATTRAALDALKNNAATIEQYAREKYLMKRDNEDLFIIATKEKE